MREQSKDSVRLLHIVEAIERINPAHINDEC